MSLILEALKRSENERLRKSKNASNLVTSSFGSSEKTEKRSWVPQFLAIALVVNAVLLGGLYLSSKNQPEELAAAVENQAEPTEVSANQFATNNANEFTPETTQTTVQAEKRVVKAATPLAEELIKDKPTTYSQSSNDSWDEQAVAENAAPTIPTDFAMIETQETNVDTSNDEPVSLRELTDDSLADKLENYEINTHIYNAEDQSRSFVLLNMEKYRVGDTLNNTDFEVADITSEGIVIDHGSGQVLISAN